MTEGEEVENSQPGQVRFTTVPVYRRVKPRVPPLYLSPTSIAVFKQCRQRYKFLYIDGLSREYGRPKPYFTMANHVHATLRDFLSLKPVELRTPTAIEELLRRNWRRYRVGFRDRDDEARWAQKALMQLSAFVSTQDIYVEPVMMEESLEVEITPGLILRCRVDRVDRQPDGSLHVIDYKTGNVAEEMDWTQLEVQALVVSRRLPWPVSRISYLYLGSSSIQSSTTSPEDMRRVHWAVLNTAREVRHAKKFLPNPGLWCSTCDFISICPRKTQAEPLAEAGAQLELWDELGEDFTGGH